MNLEEHYKEFADGLRIRDEPLDSAFVVPVRRKLSKYSYRLLGNWPDAEDAVQECYCRALKYYPTFKGESSEDLDNWIFIILANSINSIRRQALGIPETIEADDTIKADEYLVEGDTSEQLVEIERWREMFDKLSFNLSTRDLSILQLHFVYGHKIPNVSELLDVNKHTVRRIINLHRKDVLGG